MAALALPTKSNNQQLEEKKIGGVSRKETKNKGKRDYIVLNVGGTKFSTRLETLLSVPGSYFANVFGPRFNPEDATKEFFIDRDPQLFRVILNYLRSHNIKYVWTGSLKMDRKLHEEAKFFGLHDLQEQIEGYTPKCEYCGTLYLDAVQEASCPRRVVVHKMEEGDFAVLTNCERYKSKKRYRPTFLSNDPPEHSKEMDGQVSKVLDEAKERGGCAVWIGQVLYRSCKVRQVGKDGQIDKYELMVEKKDLVALKCSAGCFSSPGVLVDSPACDAKHKFVLKYTANSASSLSSSSSSASSSSSSSSSQAAPLDVPDPGCELDEHAKRQKVERPA